MTPFSHMSVDDIQFLERTKVLLSERGINQMLDFHSRKSFFLSLSSKRLTALCRRCRD